MAWFLGGELNASYNCVVRHALKTPEKVKHLHFFLSVKVIQDENNSSLSLSLYRLPSFLKGMNLEMLLKLPLLNSWIKSVK
jgi:hypothetical protein